MNSIIVPTEVEYDIIHLKQCSVVEATSMSLIVKCDIDGAIPLSDIRAMGERSWCMTSENHFQIQKVAYGFELLPLEPTVLLKRKYKKHIKICY